MSTSNSPQTLFRFVSYRNPNLAENSEKNLRFIYRPKGFEGFFDSVNESSDELRLQQLRSLANEFKLTPKVITSVATLEESIYADLLKIGKNLGLSKKLSTDELKSAKDWYQKLKSETTEVSDLWDNLIYQYITQNNFYVKEAIAHILSAFHMGYVQTLSSTDELKSINGNEFLDVAAEATIVLPEFLFHETMVRTVKGSPSKLSARHSNFLEVNLEKQLILSDHEQSKVDLQQLKSELQTIQSNADKSYDKKYRSALQKYQEDNAEKVSLYEKQLEVVYRLEDNKAPDQEIKDAYDLLQTYEYPPFEFESQKVLSWKYLYPNLSLESFSVFLENFTNVEAVIKKEIDYSKAKISVVSDEELEINDSIVSITYETLSDVYNEIDGQSQSFSQKLLTGSNLPKEEFANIGNVLIPVSANRVGTITHLAYIFRTVRQGSFWSGTTNRGYATLQIQLENTSWNISHASLTATTNLGDQTENFTNLEVIDNLITFPRFLVNKFRTISDFNLTIFFANGRETSLELTDVSMSKNITGILVLKPVIEVPTDGGDGDNDDTDTTEPPFSGKHFGVKRLGVAEYMKVVQTVHAYVPGEVSNIENVMASELRHKSISELTRTEETITTTKSQEVEKISDTSKVNRAEMQTEVSKEIEKQKSFQAHANFSRDGVWKIDLGATYATNSSQFNSNRQAVTKSQEITERAMERVQSKITEERMMKIIQEVSLTNVHEFDNRGGISPTAPKHITGVYRWVDKKMKNQIFNYGLRTMFEFMIPEPAKLHRLAYKNSDTLVAPVDPRKAPAPHNMANGAGTTKAMLEYWADIYGVSLTDEPVNKQQFITIEGQPATQSTGIFYGETQEVMEDYKATSATMDWYFSKQRHEDSTWHGGGRLTGKLNFSDLKGNKIIRTTLDRTKSGTETITNLNLTDSFFYTVDGTNISKFTIAIKLQCVPKDSLLSSWRVENFNAIIAAYIKANDDYKAEKANIEAERKANEDNQKEAQSNFYRIIEGDVIKHNCVAYLLQNYLTTMGQDFTSGDEMLDFKVNLSDDLDKYTAKAKFLEQAFEWSIMDYTFYPYFWADRKAWQEMYLTENIDALFRGFLQAGLARVIVTVKPGFEKAVQYFLTTGEVWLGGETPIIGDPLYVSIVQEMQEPTGTPQGNYWITRIPTTLTILQSGSTGLPTDEEQPLPIFPELDPTQCENPDELEGVSAFEVTEDLRMSGSGLPSTLQKN